MWKNKRLKVAKKILKKIIRKILDKQKFRKRLSKIRGIGAGLDREINGTSKVLIGNHIYK